MGELLRRKFLVTRKDKELTLLAFLRMQMKQEIESGGISVKKIKRLIDQGSCLINDRVETFSTHKVFEGDAIEIGLLENAPLEPTIVFEDQELIAYNKPAGMTTESFPSSRYVHRLDKGTTGVLLIPKNEEIYLKMRELFAKREVEKKYLAICAGLMPKNHLHEKGWYVVDNFLGKIGAYQGMTVYGRVPEHRGKRAHTIIQPLREGTNATLVRAIPMTGRTHQIRVHLKDLGHPVLGDWLYGQASTSYLPKTTLLHAEELSFIHPRSGKKIVITAPVSPDFLEAKKNLKL